MTNRPQGEPTHYLPLWQGSQGDYLDADGGEYFPSEAPEAIPAERLTVAPEPYTPKAGDRVMTDLGYEATVINPDPDTLGRIAICWSDEAGGRYATLDPVNITGKTGS